MPHVEHGSVTSPLGVGRGGLPPSAQAVYERALRRAGASPLRLHADGWSKDLPVARWCGDADSDDVALLERFTAALPERAEVLDVGCGPGRHTAWLRGAGVRALGVDTSPTAVALAHGRGAPALLADALGPLPGGHHGWDAVLLLDGNIGIGGDPLLLLCRVRDLLRPYGQLLVELERSGESSAELVCLDDGDRPSATFPWARLGEAQLRRDACAAGLAVLEVWHDVHASYAVLVAR